MDFAKIEDLKQQLLASDSHFAALASQHGEFEQRLSELAELRYPSPDEQIEETILKKKKLQLKDQMEEILNKYSGYPGAFKN